MFFYQAEREGKKEQEKCSSEFIFMWPISSEYYRFISQIWNNREGNSLF